MVTATEEGIRDLVDEDGEVDAAARAALVRQSASEAMHAIRRAEALERAGDALAFGRITDDDGESLYIGRLSVVDGDEVRLVDWRAPAAAPFYRATPLERFGVVHRRHLVYDDKGPPAIPELVGYSDEVFDVEVIIENLDQERTHLRGEAAILASLEAPSAGHMRSVVATIQAEQDAVVRAPAKQTLVVQGGPGTGKTVVALHRAAYLLYNQRSMLAESGVLVVGPTAEFLTYISQVLPSLGETGVVSSTAAELYPGLLRGWTEPVEVSELKGQEVMAQVLANALRDRQRRPDGPLQVWFGTNRVRLDVGVLVEQFELAGRHRTHNDGAAAFRRGVIEALVGQVDDPVFERSLEAEKTFAANPVVRHFLLRHWPPLQPEQALNDLCGSRALLRSAAKGTDLGEGDLALLERERTAQADLEGRRWSDADVPLLDELLALLGGALGSTESERIRERDAADAFELADRHDIDDAQAGLARIDDELAEAGLSPELFDEDLPESGASEDGTEADGARRELRFPPHLSEADLDGYGVYSLEDERWAPETDEGTGRTTGRKGWGAG